MYVLNACSSMYTSGRANSTAAIAKQSTFVVMALAGFVDGVGAFAHGRLPRAMPRSVRSRTGEGAFTARSPVGAG